MYLKRMELFGFKSFAEKSELSLSPGISAVIGPNGCGKSNIVDAVRWALGEQSVKSLRGTKMEEIIFSGTDSRKPLNFAEVSITFDGASSFLNLDYDEITITRRLFRNGDSEYYINKSPCRLKDITELFLDTGLGKDIYSVIGQGRVDDIINSRPEERREIFEEAAGIFKYKMRKKEARRRLDETRENLVRVQDLIYELETQIDPLKEQAEVTRKYRDLQQRTQSEEKQLLSFRLQNSRDELSRVEKQLQNLNEAMISSAAEGGLHEKEVQEIKSSLQECHFEKRELEQTINNLSRKLEQKESDLKILFERESRYTDQLEQNRNRIERLDLLAKEYTDQRTRAEAELTEKESNLQTAKSELQALQVQLSGLESSALANSVESRQEEIYKAGVRRESALSTIEELKRRLERLEKQKESKGEEEKLLKDNLARAEKAAANIRDRVKAAETNLTEVQKVLEEERKREENLKLDLEKAAIAEQSKREELYGINSRLNLLQEQDAALSGYYRGVKEIMQTGADHPAIIGPVGDLISVESDYTQAVESALGGSLQYLVAETEKAAQGAIQFLKENKRGWATFLPLDILQKAADPLERYPGWRDLQGVVGKASELVKVEPAYQKAIDYLMSSVLICRTLEDASRAARFIKYSCRVVTLDGEMINPGGIMRGGSMPKRNAGMPLGRRKEIEDLQKKKLVLLNSVQNAEENVREVKKTVADAAMKAKDTLELKEKKEMQLHEVEKEYEEAEREKRIISERIATAVSFIEEQGNEEKEVIQRQAELEIEVEKSSGNIEKLEQELLALKEDYRQYIEEKTALEQQITGLLVKVNSYHEQREALENRIKEVESNLDSPAAEKLEKINDSEKVEEELIKNRKEQKAIREEIQDLNAKKADFIAGLESKSELANQLEASLIDLEEQSRRRQNKVSRQEKRERQLSVEQGRLQTEINYQEIRFKELFSDLQLVQLDEDFEPTECERIIGNLKEDLAGLGEVNLGAIDELARLEDRINFLTEQKDDLQKGEVSLQKVLAEIDQRMEHYFKNAFEKINENFRQTFEELFEGGKVMLKLTDSDNMLESGIEIVAQPPGKKLQNITLLSAGEKVLTAIALVFAILRFKPAPFYLLDEVESTLDDANLSRFTKFLKQTAEQAQFILITHRKRTMEEAGVLYGVTMPEPGISRLMSLKLEDNIFSRES